MTYKHASARYRQWYAKLLRFYPKAYHERFAEGMQQTFNDLCCERYQVGDRLFGFVLWTFADTIVGIIKETIEKENIMMNTILKKHGATIIWIITGIATAGTALLVKGSEYENAWLWVFSIGIVLAGFTEAYLKIKDQNK
ncbi:MAG TPA: hypothetical protein DIS90_01345 [Cytophagales bacterium]|nr:hypothetical protein [Cytophagales bacterium]